MGDEIPYIGERILHIVNYKATSQESFRIV